jgi:hypothetical protein
VGQAAHRTKQKQVRDSGELRVIMYCRYLSRLLNLGRQATYTLPKAKGWCWFKAIWKGFPVHSNEKRKIREFRTVSAPMKGKMHSRLL